MQRVLTGDDVVQVVIIITVLLARKVNMTLSHAVGLGTGNMR